MAAEMSSVPRVYDPPDHYNPDDAENVGTPDDAENVGTPDVGSRVIQHSRSVSSESLHPKRPSTFPPIDNELVGEVLTKGWTWELYIALIHGILSLLWGIALAIFTAGAGIVQVFYYLETISKLHPGVQNVITTTVAALCTMHTKFVLTKTFELYTTHSLHHGFTMRSLRRMQGMMEWTAFTPIKPLKRGSLIWKAGWVVLFTGMALHTASIVAVLQTVAYNLHAKRPDRTPCGISPDLLTLERPTKLPPSVIAQMDKLSHDTALGLSNYYERIISNETSSFMGRLYVKDHFAYSAVGGEYDSTHDYPGLMFNATCSPTVTLNNTTTVSSLWSSTFPTRQLPTLNLTDTGAVVAFVDPVDGPNLQSLTSPAMENVDTFLENPIQQLVYALVKSNGDGGILVVDITGNQLFGCTWSAIPVLVKALQMGLIYTVEAYEDAIPGLVVAAPASRAVLTTVNGIVHAVQLGATVQFSGSIYTRLKSIQFQHNPNGLPETAFMLQTLLADGCKAAMTVYTSYFAPILLNGTDIPADVTSCDPNNVSLVEHWCFGNQNNLGWIAILWTIGAGLFSIMTIIRLRSQTRVVNVDGFNVVTLFKLGVSSAKTVGLDVDKDRELCLQGGRLVDKRLLPLDARQDASVDENESFLGYPVSR